MSQEHTPGPWEYGRNEYAIKQGTLSNRIVVRPAGQFPHGDWIADCGSDSNAEQVANARLIAAAPDLLACLKDAIGRLEEWIGTDCECDNTHEQNGTTCCLCQYRAAIARAKG